MKITSATLAFPVLALALVCGACDAPTSDDDVVDANEELGQAQQGLCIVTASVPPSVDASGSLVGSPTAVAGSGTPSSTGCDLWTVKATAQPSNGTDKGRWAYVSWRQVMMMGEQSDDSYCDDLDVQAHMWTRNCTQSGICTSWSLESIPLDTYSPTPGQPSCHCPDINSPCICDCIVEGVEWNNAYDTATEIRVGARDNVTGGPDGNGIYVSISEGSP